MRTRILLVVLLVLGAMSPASAAWRETTHAPEQTALLMRVEQLVVQTPRPVVVFDLDSTLYKNHGRWAVIAREFGREKHIPELQRLRVDAITDSFDHLRVLAEDAGLGKARATALLEEFKTFWTARFFTDRYIKHDAPLPGAVNFVRGLYERGAFVVYLTGRDEQNMRRGTVAKLRRDGFPIEQPRTAIFLKPAANLAMGKDAKRLGATDRDWKAGAIEDVRRLGTVVASFENEPGTINLYYDQFHRRGTGVAVFLDTDMFHASRGTALRRGVKTIHGFLR